MPKNNTVTQKSNQTPSASLQQQIKWKLWKNARQVIKDEFAADPNPGGIRHGFLCNIAMMLYDKYGMDINVANCAADDLIKLVFEDTYY